MNRRCSRYTSQKFLSEIPKIRRFFKLNRTEFAKLFRRSDETIDRWKIGLTLPTPAEYMILRMMWLAKERAQGRTWPIDHETRRIYRIFQLGFGDAPLSVTKKQRRAEKKQKPRK